MDIQGKCALVTGSARRLGRSMAIELARRGARIAVHFRSDSSEEEAQETLRLIRDAGGEGAIFRAELRDVPQLDRMFAAIGEKFGNLHILVNSASVFSPSTA